MSDLVPSEDIERIVGIQRHNVTHYGRAVSADQTVYVMHSNRCLNSGIDLRQCPFSLALDEGIDVEDWAGREDVAVALRVRGGRLVPLRGRRPEWSQR